MIDNEQLEEWIARLRKNTIQATLQGGQRARRQHDNGYERLLRVGVVDPARRIGPGDHAGIAVPTPLQMARQGRHFIGVECARRGIDQQQWLGQVPNALQPLLLDQPQHQVELDRAAETGIEPSSRQRHLAAHQPVAGHGQWVA
ncbi:hypothetical protein D3C79_867820 [compost metagenome]